MKAIIVLSMCCFSILCSFQAHDTLKYEDEKTILEVCYAKLNSTEFKGKQYKAKLFNEILTVRDLKKVKTFHDKNDQRYRKIYSQLQGKRFVRVLLYSEGKALDGSFYIYVDVNSKEILRIDNY